MADFHVSGEMAPSADDGVNLEDAPARTRHTEKTEEPSRRVMGEKKRVKSEVKELTKRVMDTVHNDALEHTFEFYLFKHIKDLCCSKSALDPSETDKDQATTMQRSMLTIIFKEALSPTTLENVWANVRRLIREQSIIQGKFDPELSNAKHVLLFRQHIHVAHIIAQCVKEVFEQQYKESMLFVKTMESLKRRRVELNQGNQLIAMWTESRDDTEKDKKRRITDIKNRNLSAIEKRLRQASITKLQKNIDKVDGYISEKKEEVGELSRMIETDTAIIGRLSDNHRTACTLMPKLMKHAAEVSRIAQLYFTEATKEVSMQKSESMCKTKPTLETNVFRDLDTSYEDVWGELIIDRTKHPLQHSKTMHSKLFTIVEEFSDAFPIDKQTIPDGLRNRLTKVTEKITSNKIERGPIQAMCLQELANGRPEIESVFEYEGRTDNFLTCASVLSTVAWDSWDEDKKNYSVMDRRALARAKWIHKCLELSDSRHTRLLKKSKAYRTLMANATRVA
jgi:hypothetical protein